MFITKEYENQNLVNSLQEAGIFYMIMKFLNRSDVLNMRLTCVSHYILIEKYAKILLNEFGINNFIDFISKRGFSMYSFYKTFTDSDGMRDPAIGKVFTTNFNCIIPVLRDNPAHGKFLFLPPMGIIPSCFIEYVITIPNILKFGNILKLLFYCTDEGFDMITKFVANGNINEVAKQITEKQHYNRTFYYMSPKIASLLKLLSQEKNEDEDEFYEDDFSEDDEYTEELRCEKRIDKLIKKCNAKYVIDLSSINDDLSYQAAKELIPKYLDIHIALNNRNSYDSYANENKKFKVNNYLTVRKIKELYINIISYSSANFSRNVNYDIVSRMIKHIRTQSVKCIQYITMNIRYFSDIARMFDYDDLYKLWVKSEKEIHISNRKKFIIILFQCDPNRTINNQDPEINKYLFSELINYSRDKIDVPFIETFMKYFHIESLVNFNNNTRLNDIKKKIHDNIKLKDNVILDGIKHEITSLPDLLVYNDVPGFTTIEDILKYKYFVCGRKCTQYLIKKCVIPGTEPDFLKTYNYDITYLDILIELNRIVIPEIKNENVSSDEIDLTAKVVSTGELFELSTDIIDILFYAEKITSLTKETIIDFIENEVEIDYIKLINKANIGLSNFTYDNFFDMITLNELVNIDVGDVHDNSIYVKFFEYCFDTFPDKINTVMDELLDSNALYFIPLKYCDHIIKYYPDAIIVDSSNQLLLRKEIREYLQNNLNYTIAEEYTFSDTYDIFDDDCSNMLYYNLKCNA